MAMVRADALASLPIVRGLTSVELEELASYLVDGRAKPQERIIREGDPAGHPIYLLLKGSVDVVKGGLHHGTHVIGSLSAPSVFGEVEVLARRPAIASVIATGDCELALLQRGVFDELATANRSAILKVIKNLAMTLSYRLAATDERLAAFFDLSGEPAERQLGPLRGVIYSSWKQE
jgi:CRP-like cAMP-binding protein